MRAHVQKRATATKKRPADPRALAQLTGPAFPHALDYLYTLHIRMGKGRRYGMNGAEPTSDLDLFAFQRNRQIVLSPDECDALIELSHVEIATSHSTTEQSRPKGGG